MRSITIAQALTLRKALNDAIGTLCNERYASCRLITYDANDEDIRKQLMPKRSFDDVTKIIITKRTELRNLQAAINKANITTLTDYVEGEHPLTISEAWMLAMDTKQERDAHDIAGRMEQRTVRRGKREAVFNPETKRNEYMTPPDTIQECPANVKACADAAEAMDAKYRKLDAAIQRANWTVNIDLDEINVSGEEIGMAATE